MQLNFLPVFPPDTILAQLLVLQHRRYHLPTPSIISRSLYSLRYIFVTLLGLLSVSAVYAVSASVKSFFRTARYIYFLSIGVLYFPATPTDPGNILLSHIVYSTNPSCRHRPAVHTFFSALYLISRLYNYRVVVDFSRFFASVLIWSIQNRREIVSFMNFVYDTKIHAIYSLQFSVLCQFFTPGTYSARQTAASTSHCGYHTADVQDITVQVASSYIRFLIWVRCDPVLHLKIKW